MHRAFKSAVVAAALIPAALIATPDVASAASNGYAWACWIKPGSATNGGCAKFYADGDTLRVWDYTADGWGTRAQIQKLLPDSNGVMHWVNHSSDCFDDTSTSNTNKGATVCNYNVTEGIQVRVHVWASHSGTTAYHIYSPSITA
ncbi:hypothetical protein ACFO1B_49660 [Dactylosporangium siamense]|uniref:Secreted protein n=2 Tax=Dactylosporangium siamense TaxID=685454 RepID=A0A919PXB1_9ACTN|nr:hypothetical protein Dsi01nite_100650 [Dactylosporangium siamense]